MDIEEIRDKNAVIASLRGQGSYQEAIDMVRSTISKVVDQEDCLTLLVQGLYAARELGDEAEARQFASEIFAIDPGVPSARALLGLD